MKNVAIGTMGFIVLLLSIFILFSVNGKTERKNELETALNNSMTTALNGIMENSEYAPQSNEELIAEFEQAFFTEINSMSDITLNYLDVDYEKGLLSVEAISKFKYLTGTPGSVAVKKTIILDVYEDESGKVEYDVTYKVYGKTYRSYKVGKGENLIVPPELNLDNVTVSGWKNTKTEQIYQINELQTLICEKDMEFIAVIN